MQAAHGLFSFADLGEAGVALERLGETSEFGWFILNLLSLNGWSASVMPLVGGEGVIVELSRRGVPVTIRACGSNVAECAPELLRQASMYMRVLSA